MPIDPMQGRKVTRCGLAATLFATILLSACDGGIFGTGSGSDADVIVPGAISQGESTGDDSSITDGGATGAGSATQSPGDSVDMPGQTGGDAAGFINTLAGGVAMQPRVRLINTTGQALRLFYDDGSVLRLLTRSAAGDTGSYANVPDTSESLVVVRAAASEASAETVTDREVLYRIAPLELGVASVSSLVVSASEIGSGISVTPLATITRSDDAAQALVRIVPTLHLANAGEPPETTFRLTPAGEAPGGVEVNFVATSAATPSSAYVAVPAGDYRLSASDARIDERALSIAAGTVYTLLVSGRESLLVIVDGSD